MDINHKLLLTCQLHRTLYERWRGETGDTLSIIPAGLHAANLTMLLHVGGHVVRGSRHDTLSLWEHTFLASIPSFAFHFDWRTGYHHAYDVTTKAINNSPEYLEALEGAGTVFTYDAQISSLAQYLRKHPELMINSLGI